MLIQPEDLQKELKRPALRLLDTRPQAEYAKGHIPGAVRVEVKSWQDLGKKEGGLHDAKAWGENVGNLGIAADSQVVVYGSAPTDTARIWWTLKYLGLPNVMILDGGWNLWAKEKRTADDTIPTIEVVKFEPKFQADRLEEMDSLKKAVRSGAVTVVDTRSAAEFTGRRSEASGRTSPVPSTWSGRNCWPKMAASSHPNSCGHCSRARHKTGANRRDLLTSGGRASVEAFALELAGYPKVRCSCVAGSSGARMPRLPWSRSNGEMTPTVISTDTASTPLQCGRNPDQAYATRTASSLRLTPPNRGRRSRATGSSAQPGPWRSFRW